MSEVYRPKLMVVDDNEDVQKVLNDFLSSVGCDVIGLLTAEAAWAALTVGQAQVDVIILDWDLPLGMSGPVLNKKLKAHEEFRNIPVIFYTANWTPKVLNRSFMDWLAAVTAMQRDGKVYADSVISKRKLPGPHPGLLLNIAAKLEEIKKPIPVELDRAVNLLKKQGFDATDEVLRMGRTEI